MLKEIAPVLARIARRTALAVASTLLVLVGSAHAAPGDPVASFGTAGFAGSWEAGVPDAETVGSGWDFGTGDASTYRHYSVGMNTQSPATIVIARRLSSGELDDTFGGDGIVTIDTEAVAVTAESGSDWLNARDSYFDGSRLVIAVDGEAGLAGTLAVSEAGVVDTTYGNDGYALTPVGDGPVTVTDLAWDPYGSGRVVVSGYAQQIADPGNERPFLVSIDSFGAFDTDFAGDGSTTYDTAATTERFNAATIREDGSVLVAGMSGMNWLAMQVAANGSPVFAFGGGDATFLAATPGEATSVVETEAGFVLGGISTAGADGEAALLALDGAGVPVAAFGTNGLAALDTGAGDAIIRDVTASEGGYVAVADIATFSDVAVLRATSTGALDAAFAGDGIAEIAHAGFTYADAATVMVLPEGPYFVAGTARTGLGDRGTPFFASVEGAAGATPPPASVVQFSSSGTSVTEGSFELVVIERTNASAPGSVKVRLKAASDDITFAERTVDFAAGETTKSVQVVPVNDTADEASPEVAQLELFDPVGLTLGTRVVTNVLIVDNDEPAPAPPTPTPPVSIIGTPQDPFASLFGYASLTEIKEVPATASIGVDIQPSKTTPPGIIGDAAGDGVRFKYAVRNSYRFANVADVQQKLASLSYDASTGRGYHLDVAVEPWGLQDMDPSYRPLVKAGDVVGHRGGEVVRTTPSERMQLRVRYYEPERNCGPTHNLVNDALRDQRTADRTAGGYPYTKGVAFLMGTAWTFCSYDVVFRDKKGIAFSRIVGEKPVQQKGKWVLRIDVEVPAKADPPKPRPCPTAAMNNGLLGKPWYDSRQGAGDGAVNLYLQFQRDQELYDCNFDVRFEKKRYDGTVQAMRIESPRAISGRGPKDIATIVVWEPEVADLVTTVRFNPFQADRTYGRTVPPLQDGKLSSGSVARFTVTVSQAGVAIVNGEQARLLGGAEVTAWFDPSGVKSEGYILGAVKLNAKKSTGANPQLTSNANGETPYFELELPGPGTLRLETAWRGVSNGVPKTLTGWHTYQVVDRAAGCYGSTVPGVHYQTPTGPRTTPWRALRTCPKGTARSKSTTLRQHARGANYDKCLGGGGNWVSCAGAGLLDLFGVGVSGSKVAVPPDERRVVASTCMGGGVSKLPPLPLTGASSAILAGADGSRSAKSETVVSIPSTCVTTAMEELDTTDFSRSGMVIATGGGNVISVGGGNVIASGGGNVISVGGGNVISVGGGNVIATGGGNVISTGGLNLIGQAGGNVIATGGGN